MRNLGVSTDREDVAVKSSQSHPRGDLLYRVSTPRTFCIGKAVIVRDVARYVILKKNYMMFHDTTVKNAFMDTIDTSMNMYHVTKDEVNKHYKEKHRETVIKRIKHRYRLVEFHDVKFKGAAVVSVGRDKIKKRAFHYICKFSYCPVYITPFCDNQDSMGFCFGHQMTRSDFLDRFCDGVEPPTLEELWG